MSRSLSILINVFQLLIEHRNYAHLNTYIFKADASLDAAIAINSPATAPPTGGTPVLTAATTDKKSTGIDNVQSKLDLATALSHLASTSYEKAAISFLGIGPPKILGDWIGKVSFSLYKIALLKYHFSACGTWRYSNIWNAMCSRDLPAIGYQVEHFGKLYLWVLYGARAVYVGIN